MATIQYIVPEKSVNQHLKLKPMQKQTTVTIDQKTFATLDRLAKSNKIVKGMGGMGL